MKCLNIDGIEIPFDQDWKNIAISLSGGSDSALLSYIICNFAEKPITLHCISHTRMWKTRPWQSWDSLRVFNWLVERFPRITFQRHTNFIAPELEYGNIGPSLKDEYGKTVSGDNIEIRSFSEYICHWNNVDAYFNAVTRNPKKPDLGGLKERNVDPTESNQHLRLMKHMGRWAVHPFRFVEKSWVIKQYKTFGLQELLSLTRSCEGEFENLDYRNYQPNQEVPVCEKCFWCKERKWAIEQNQ